MPAPFVYVVAVVGTVAAGYAFYELVYEPHIVPWAHNLRANFNARREQRRRRLQPRIMVPFGQRSRDVELDRFRYGGEVKGETTSSMREKDPSIFGSGLRNRFFAAQKPRTATPSVASTLDERLANLPYPTMRPTHAMDTDSDAASFISSLSASSRRTNSTLRSPAPMSPIVSTPATLVDERTGIEHSINYSPPPPPQQWSGDSPRQSGLSLSNRYVDHDVDFVSPPGTPFSFSDLSVSSPRLAASPRVLSPHFSSASSSSLSSSISSVSDDVNSQLFFSTAGDGPEFVSTHTPEELRHNADIEAARLQASSPLSDFSDMSWSRVSADGRD